MLQQLALRGQHGVAADLLDRMTYDGDTGMTSKIEAYLKGDTSAIEALHPSSVALKNGSRAKLSTAEQRVGTAFDPGNSAFDQNYRMQFPDGSEVPVLGHDAYGGTVNRFGEGEFSGSELEKRLAALADAHNTNGDTELARKMYLDELTKTVYGKNSFYRASGVDPMGAGQFVQTRASTLRYSDGTVNPFEIGIGSDTAARLGIDAENSYAMLARHPVSHAPMVRVVIDKNLDGTRSLLAAHI
jgi:hypothetical protein